MNKELERRLIDKYPAMFVNMYGDPTQTCMAWGCDVGDGWFGLIAKTCARVQAVLDADKSKSLTFVFAQIKEKFGGLRLYYDGSFPQFRAIINDAESESFLTCEECGTKKNVETKGHWIKTLCEKCRGEAVKAQ